MNTRIAQALALLLLVTAATLPAQVPQLLNYQGRVAVGAVNFDGPGAFKFALVDAAGTTTYWSNDGTSTAGSQPTAAVTLTVTKGLYSVLLGDTTLANMTAIPTSVFANADVRLRVWFNDGTNGFQLMAPDQRLAPNGYLADGSVTGTKIANGAVGSAQLASGAASSAIAAGTIIPTQSVAGTSQTATANTSYAATNAALTTFSLPATANVGDTIQITGSGAGGWTVEVGGANGTTTPHESSRAWQSVASSSDGSKLVAVEFGGQIYISADSGVTWTPRDSNRAWHSVASSADGSMLVAVVTSGQIYTSTDSGVTWAPRDSSRAWQSVASSADGSKLVALENGGQIYTSADSGVNWTPRDSNRGWFSVASSADGSKLVAVVGLGGQIYTSTDSGVNWTPRESSRSWRSVASSADGSKLVAVAFGGQIYTSTDSGVSWTPRDTGRGWQSVASSADGSKLVAAEKGGQIYTSADSGVSWTPRDTGREWFSLASSADGSKLVAVVYGGQIYTLTTIPVTATGVQGSSATLQYLGNGVWAPVSQTQIAAGAVGSTQLASGLTLLGATSGTFSGPLTGNVTGNVSGSAASFTGLLTGDVTGTQDATVVSVVGSVPAANVATGANLAIAATSANTPNVIVKRDASGNFSAGTISAALNGNASTASNVGGLPAANVAAGANLANAAVSTNTTNTLVKRDASGNFSAGTISAALNGNASTATTATNASNVGGVTAANVATGANLSNAATSANTANVIVKRDASGNFSAGAIAATLIGNASTATSATTAATATTAGNVSGIVAIVNGGTGSATQSFVDLSTTQSIAGTKTFNGTVGIGTTPATKLHVDGGTAANLPNNTGFMVIGSQSSTNVVFDNNQILARNNGAGSPFYINSQSGSGNTLLNLVSGNVGIGTATPTQAKLVVTGSENTAVGNHGYLNNSGAGTAAGGFVPTSIWAGSGITALNFNTQSDARIKAIAGRSDSFNDLATLLDVAVTDYTYVDTITKGSAPQKKVIAQQVEKVFPQAVSKHTDVVPDIYQKAEIKDGWVMLATDLKKGDRVKLISEKKEEIHEVLEAAKDKFRTDFKPEGDDVFVYGREVKDFRTVDYEAIAMLNVSATQELARKIEQQRIENEQLKTQLAQQAKELAALKALEARLAQLEQTAPAKPAGGAVPVKVAIGK